jgi:hypothetical protein
MRRFGPTSLPFSAEDRIVILDRLREQHLGEENAITVRALGLEVGLDDDAQQTRLRRTLADALDEGAPVGASRKGYFWIASEEERTENIRVLESRRDSIARRIAALQAVQIGA